MTSEKTTDEDWFRVCQGREPPEIVDHLFNRVLLRLPGDSPADAGTILFALRESLRISRDQAVQTPEGREFFDSLIWEVESREDFKDGLRARERLESDFLEATGEEEGPPTLH